MADICKCPATAKQCAKRDSCYRFTALSGMRQTQFVKAPIDADGNCEHYWEVIDPKDYQTLANTKGEYNG